MTAFTWFHSEDPKRSMFDMAQMSSPASRSRRACSLSRLHMGLKEACLLNNGSLMKTSAWMAEPSIAGFDPRNPRCRLHAKEAVSESAMRIAPSALQSRRNAALRSGPAWWATSRRCSSSLTQAARSRLAFTKTPRASGQSLPRPAQSSRRASGALKSVPSALSWSSSCALMPPGRSGRLCEPRSGRYSPLSSAPRLRRAPARSPSASRRWSRVRAQGMGSSRRLRLMLMRAETTCAPRSATSTSHTWLGSRLLGCSVSSEWPGCRTPMTELNTSWKHS
mmetsp:Transcript_36544/g.104436  ORF Transcript_36544/g.104436 Transcript_36544/m.104436 type:complete len:279 (+) Transcript_36544:274-1110(+)